MKKTIRFHKAKEVQEGRDAYQVMFNYSIVDSTLIGQPEEESSTQYYRIKTSISGTLLTMWDARDQKLSDLRNVVKILYEFSWRHIIEKLKENTLMEYEELWLHTASQPKACPFNPDKIVDNLSEAIKSEIGNEELMQDITLLQLATSIIELRDYINAKFKEIYGHELLLISCERDLLNLFKDALSNEEFSFRLNALQNLVTQINVKFLREITGIQDNQKKSISLLEAYLKTLSHYDDSIVEVYRNINRMRQAYPIHGNNTNGVQEAFAYFNIDYPNYNFSESWKILLTSYRNTLQKILEIMSSKT